MEAGQQSDEAGRCLPSTVVIRSGRCPGVKGGAFGGGFGQALAGQAEAMGVVHEAVEDGVVSSSPSALRCVSTTVDARRHILPASDRGSASLAEPLCRDAN